MTILSQFFGIVATTAVTYLFYIALGPRNNSLFYTREQETQWNSKLRASLGNWLVITGFFATLTSFATYLFLMGSVKLFGWFALATGLTIALSPYVTNSLTVPLRNDDRVKRLLFENNQISGVIASLFWSTDQNSRNVSRIIKWTSLVVILSIIWLECSLFVDLSVYLATGRPDNEELIAIFKFSLMFLVAFSIIYFVLKYGIRGFVFADLIHTPIILAAASSILIVVVNKLSVSGNR